MKTIQISDDTADALFREILIDDYNGLKADIAKLQANGERKPYEDEDLAHNKKYLAAIEVMMEYYVGFSWKKFVVDKRVD